MCFSCDFVISRRDWPSLLDHFINLDCNLVHEVGNKLYMDTNLLARGLEPNARPELRPEAGAQRTLEAVSSRPLFGGVARLPHRMSGDGIRLNPCELLRLRLLRMIQIPAQLQVHPEIC